METGRTRSHVAPYDSMSLGFSVAASSGSMRCALHPSALATMARDTPVLPAVPSVTVPPRMSSPDSSASVRIRSATRSLTLPPGLANSHLIMTSQPVASERELTRIMGVLPMDASTSGMGGGGGKCTPRVDGACGGGHAPNRSQSARAMKRMCEAAVGASATDVSADARRRSAEEATSHAPAAALATAVPTSSAVVAARDSWRSPICPTTVAPLT